MWIEQLKGTFDVLLHPARYAQYVKELDDKLTLVDLRIQVLNSVVKVDVAAAKAEAEASVQAIIAEAEARLAMAELIEDRWKQIYCVGQVGEILQEIQATAPQRSKIPNVPPPR